MPRYALFNTLPDLAIPGPGKIKKIKKLAKLIVIHKSHFKVSGIVIQGNKFVPEVVMGNRNALREDADPANKCGVPKKQSQ